MPRPDFQSMLAEMLRHGVSPRIARRVVAELGEHYDDLEAELLHHGLPAVEARRLAADRLGEPAVLLSQMTCRPDLQSWIYRFPRIARVVLPVAWVLALPAVPIFAGVAHLSSIVRWLACLLLSGLVTAAMMLVLQLSITLT